jgi:Zn finger protein HypA/HybF involved in hydrogenase expression
MRFEDKRTKCSRCKTPLIWLSHIKRWEQDRQVDEFTFHCEKCKREYLYKNDEIVEKGTERNLLAEHEALARFEFRNATNRRCPKCGGPITNFGSLFVLECEWCHERYRITEGELQISPPPPQPRMTLKDFAELYRNKP